MFIAALSTLISSIALIGVAISLFLQARQLRSSQLQAARASQIDLIKFALDHSTIAAELGGANESEDFANDMFRNWYVTHLSLSYDNGATSKMHLRALASHLFATEGTRNWWRAAGESYRTSATSRREKEFFAILNSEFQRAIQVRESVQASDGPPDASASPSPSSP